MRRLIKRWLMMYRRTKMSLNHVHPTCYIASKSFVCSDLRADAYSFINIKCYIGPRVRLGRYSMLAPYVCVIGGDHVIDNPERPMIFAGRPYCPETHIGDDCWVGWGAIIMAGVRIGNGSIIAAGSVVTKDIPPYSIAAGVPARVIRSRFSSESEIETHKKMLMSPLISDELLRADSK